MRYWVVTILLLTASSALANSQKNATVPPPFAQVKPVICAAEEKDFLDRDCQEGDYNAPIPVDLNRDGQLEWVYLGKDRLCGASANCSAAIVQKVDGHWHRIWSGGSRIVWHLHSNHLGYDDLVSYGHDSACVSVFRTLVWDGHQYGESKPVDCDYCAQEKGKRQPAICNTKFKDALFCTICDEEPNKGQQ